MSARHLNPAQTGDIQLSLFGDDTASPPAAKTIRRGQPGDHPAHYLMESTQPHVEPPKYDPNQLQLLVNPTEQLARTHRSTDMSMLHDFGDMVYRGTINQEHADRINAPTEDIRRLAAVKEWEARQPKGTYHGSGMYDIIASGEQIHTPIQSHITAQAGTDLDYQQYEGHHRLVAGAAVERDTGKQGSIWMPIKYNERRPPPPRPAHTRGGRRQNAILGMGDSDVRAGVRAVHDDAEYTSQVGRTDQYRFQNDAMDAQGWIKARNRLDPHGDATNRAAAIKAAVMMGQNQATWPKKGMGVGTAVKNVQRGRQPGDGTTDRNVNAAARYIKQRQAVGAMTEGDTTVDAIAAAAQMRRWGGPGTGDAPQAVVKVRRERKQEEALVGQGDTSNQIRLGAAGALVGGPAHPTDDENQWPAPRPLGTTSLQAVNNLTKDEQGNWHRAERAGPGEEPGPYTQALAERHDQQREREVFGGAQLQGVLGAPRPVGQRKGPGPETIDRVNELLNPAGAAALAGSLIPDLTHRLNEEAGPAGLGTTDRSNLAWARRMRPGAPASTTLIQQMDRAAAVDQAEQARRDVPNTAARNAAQQMPRVWSPPKRGQRIRLTTM